MEVEKLTTVAREIGLSGVELKEWVHKEWGRLQEERAIEREERQKDREAARELAELKNIRVQAEQEILQLRLRYQEGATSSQQSSDQNITSLQKERSCNTLGVLTATTDLYFEARRQSCWHRPGNADRAMNANTHEYRRCVSGVPPRDKKETSSSIRCFSSGMNEHRAADYWAKAKIASTPTCKRCGKTVHSNYKCQSTEKSLHQASCTVPWRFTTDVTSDRSTFVKYQDDTSIPIVNAVVGGAPKVLVDEMTVADRDLILLGLPEKIVPKRKVQHNDEVGEPQQEKTPRSRRKPRNTRKGNSGQRQKALQRKQVERTLKRVASKVHMCQGWKTGRHNWYWSRPLDNEKRRRRQFSKDMPVSGAQR